jgi:hypothetical protein
VPATSWHVWQFLQTIDLRNRVCQYSTFPYVLLLR